MTRGTTNPNRLRRVDRWLADVEGWRLRAGAEPPVVVDLGYGASPVTALEMRDRLLRVRPDVEVVGIEIDPERVRAAQGLTRPGLSFTLGGFEVAQRLPTVLIHRNVPGEAVHAYLEALDRAWERAAPQASYGVRQRWVSVCAGLREQGWPVLDRPHLVPLLV